MQQYEFGNAFTLKALKPPSVVQGFFGGLNFLRAGCGITRFADRWSDAIHGGNGLAEKYAPGRCCNMPVRRRTMRANYLCAFALCVVLLPGALRAQQALPPQAQEAFDRGMAAADQKAWDLAIRHFNDAQKLAPKNPRVLFNLGLAHDKAGHPLNGMVWLHAYLAASPKAANAEAVNKEIARLQIINETTIAKLIQQAIDVARQLPPPSSYPDPSREHTAAQNGAYWAANYPQYTQARSGDIEGALKNAPGSSSVYYNNDHGLYWLNYLEGKAYAGDIQAARDGLNHAPLGMFSDMAPTRINEDIYKFQLRVGDWDGASATANELLKLGDKSIEPGDVDKTRKEEPERRRWNALDKWLELGDSIRGSGSFCQDDLNLELALSKLETPPTYYSGNASDWLIYRGVARNLVDIADNLSSCSRSIQVIDSGLAWQASHPLPK